MMNKNGQTPSPLDRAHANPPDRTALRYRLGLHAGFLEAMRAELAARVGEPPDLALRDGRDPAIALLDAWATLADVLAFYQERIANEGFLGTARESRSVLELVRLIGYRVRPGVAASTYLAFEIEETVRDEIVIPERTRAQSLPRPGELPQLYETCADVTARRAWNRLRPRQDRGQRISLATPNPQPVLLKGAIAGLSSGTPLLIDVGEAEPRLFRIVTVEVEPKRTQTTVMVEPWSPPRPPQVEASAAPQTEAPQKIVRPQSAEAAIIELVKGERPYQKVVTDSVANQPDSQPTADEASAATPAEAIRRLQTALEPRLYDLGAALRHAVVPAQQAPVGDRPIHAVHVLRLQARPFGARAPRRFWFHLSSEWKLDDERSTVLVLDNAYETVLPGSYVVVIAPAGKQPPTPDERGAVQPDRVLVRSATHVAHGTREAYNIRARATRIELDKPWWNAGNGAGTNSEALLPAEFATIRAVTVYTQSEQLQLADLPDPRPLGPVTPDERVAEIDLDQLYEGLPNGRELILSGERAGLAGYIESEVLELTYAEQLPPDQQLPGDRYRTRLHVKHPLRHAYSRDSVEIFANVAKATHGETHREEVLGSGDGSLALQAFTLRRPQLTYIAAPTPEGVQSTLQVYVNGIRWQEQPQLASLQSDKRAYMLAADAEQRTSVQFGSGDHGARLPTGLENVRATYRTGIGAAGNTARDRITTLATRPFGVKKVTNPIPASGGVDREPDAQAQRNAPLHLQTLDRLVGLQDYEAFARTFAGIAKARATRRPGPAGDSIRVIVAAAGNTPIPTESELYKNLLAALRKAGDPVQAIEIQDYEPVALLLHAAVRIAPERRWADVERALRDVLRDHFSFARRELGQPVAWSELLAVMNAVPGVLAIDIEALLGVPRSKATDTKDLARLWQKFSEPNQPYRRTPVTVEPHELAFFFADEAPETILLEQRS